MTTKKVTDKVIARANKMFAFIDAVKLKATEAEVCAEETKEAITNETNTVVEQWKGVAQTAIKGGFKLASNQQDIISDSVDSIKEEFFKGFKRSASLFSISK